MYTPQCLVEVHPVSAGHGHGFPGAGLQLPTATQAAVCRLQDHPPHFLGMCLVSRRPKSLVEVLTSMGSGWGMPGVHVCRRHGYAMHRQ